jgi:hypothetical protein
MQAAAAAALSAGESSTATESNASDLQISTTSESEISQPDSSLTDMSCVEGVYPLSSTPKKSTKRSKQFKDGAVLQVSPDIYTPSKRAVPNSVDGDGSPSLKVRRGPKDRTFSRKEPIITNESHYQVSLFQDTNQSLFSQSSQFVLKFNLIYFSCLGCILSRAHDILRSRSSKSLHSSSVFKIPALALADKILRSRSL